MNRFMNSRIYRLLMVFLSIWVLLELALEAIIRVPGHIETVLIEVDTAICLVFLFDWFYFLCQSKDKRRYVWRHLPDLLGAIPLLGYARILRMARLIRLLRGFRSMLVLLHWIARRRMESALIIYSLWTVVIYFYCSLGIYNFEQGINRRVSGFADVLWMSFTTLTTVGYGDIYPVTWGGRLMSALLVLTGMGMMALLAGEIAAWFLKNGRNTPADESQNRPE